MHLYKLVLPFNQLITIFTPFVGILVDIIQLLLLQLLPFHKCVHHPNVPLLHLILLKPPIRTLTLLKLLSVRLLKLGNLLLVLLHEILHVVLVFGPVVSKVVG